MPAATITVQAATLQIREEVRHVLTEAHRFLFGTSGICEEVMLLVKHLEHWYQ